MWKIILLATGIGLSASGCASNPTSGPRPAPRTIYLAPVAPPVVTASVQITLSTVQAASVRAYLGSAPQSNGRGHGHNGGLPPGIAKNLERGKSLPPGIAKAYLPSHVVAGLPRLPSGLDYVVVGGKLLLVEAATAAIHDVLLDIAFDR